MCSKVVYEPPTSLFSPQTSTNKNRLVGKYKVCQLTLKRIVTLRIGTQERDRAGTQKSSRFS